MEVKPTLLIPRITKDFVKDGLKAFDHYTFYMPDVVLNFHFPDVVLFTLLAHVKKPRHILDLGSYFGLLPFIVEEISRINGCPESFEWTLVDNCLYTKELAEVVKGNIPLSSRYLTDYHLNTWHEDNVPQWKENILFEKVGKYYLPPSSALEFKKYWSGLATHYKVPMPSMTMFESIEAVQGKKFDLVHFDLTAGGYNLNKPMFENLVKNNLSEDGIVVFDDMRPQHPNMLLLFQYILESSDFRPIAFSTGKIAMMRKQYKEQFINNVNQAGLIEVSLAKDNYFSLQRGSGLESDWGDFLDLRTN